MPKNNPVTEVPDGVVPIGDLGFYTGGGSFTIPEGDYQLFFEAMMEPQHEKSNWKPRLGFNVTFHDLNDPDHRGENARTKFMSMGKEAEKTYMPDPDTGGKTLLLRENGPAFSPSPLSNWYEMLKSLYDSGLEQGIFVGDLSVLDGLHAHVQSKPESEDRKNIQANAAATGDAGQAPATRKPGLIPVVTEILKAPWRGDDCEIPDEAPAPPVKGKVAPPKGAAAKVAAPKGAASKPAAKGKAAGPDESDVTIAAQTGIGEVLEANKGGIGRTLLRTRTFKSLNASHGAAIATAVVDKYFDNGDDDLALLLGEFDFTIEGSSIKPVA